MKTIFIVVLVHYDYYRFQENLYASNEKGNCIKWAKDYNKKNNKEFLIIYTKKKSITKDKLEITHLWIQSF